MTAVDNCESNVSGLRNLDAIGIIDSVEVKSKTQRKKDAKAHYLITAKDSDAKLLVPLYRPRSKVALS